MSTIIYFNLIFLLKCKDDEENSEPPLIIDESDDFDLSDRRNTSASDLLCQGCRRNKALFMCAGCSRQWYCSKECQVSVKIIFHFISTLFFIPLQTHFLCRNWHGTITQNHVWFNFSST